MNILRKALIPFSIIIGMTCAQLAIADTSRIKRSEDVGRVEGVVAKASFGIPKEIYEMTARHTAEAFGFVSSLPLTLTLPRSSYRPCKRFTVDKNYSMEEFLQFSQQYAGSKLELTGVKRHYGVSGPLGCTFEDFKVLAGKESLSRSVEATATTVAKPVAVSFGDVTIKVYLHRRNTVMVAELLSSRSMNDDETRLWNSSCRRIQILSDIPEGAFFATNSTLKLRGVHIPEGSKRCVASSVETQ